MLLQSISKKINHLKNHTEFRKILGNTGWLFADRILRMGIGLFVMVWVARYLGVEQYGALNYASAFVALFDTISTLGLPALVIRTITESPEERDKILGTTFWLQLGGGIVTLILTVLTIFLVKPNDTLMISLVAILGSMGIFKSFDTIDLWFQSQVQSKYTVLAKNTAFIILAIVKVILINLNASLIAFAWATLAEFIVGAIGLIIAYQYQGYSLKLWRWSSALAKKLLKESWPLIFAGFTVMIYMKIDQIMLGQIIGNNAVGIYSVAARISEIWYFIPAAFSSSIAPSIFEAKRISAFLYYKKIQQLSEVLVLVSLLIALPISLFSQQIVITLFGSEYKLASTILSIHIWASLFVFLGVAVSSWYIAEGFTKIAFQRTSFALSINILLNLFLIPKYSGVGAAIATLISYAVGHVFANVIYTNTRRIFLIQMKAMAHPFFFVIKFVNKLGQAIKR